MWLIACMVFYAIKILKILEFWISDGSPYFMDEVWIWCLSNFRSAGVITPHHNVIMLLRSKRRTKGISLTSLYISARAFLLRSFRCASCTAKFACNLCWFEVLLGFILKSICLVILLQLILLISWFTLYVPAREEVLANCDATKKSVRQYFARVDWVPQHFKHPTLPGASPSTNRRWDWTSHYSFKYHQGCSWNVCDVPEKEGSRAWAIIPVCPERVHERRRTPRACIHHWFTGTASCTWNIRHRKQHIRWIPCVYTLYVLLYSPFVKLCCRERMHTVL